jgi:RND family efflux transporter MFP subunit
MVDSCLLDLEWTPRSVRQWVFFLLSVAYAAGSLAIVGCGQGNRTSAANEAVAETKTPTVIVDKPKRETLRQTVSQPGQIQAFEHTPIYPKITGYVLKWEVDIGDRVKEGQLLAELYVPELVEELKQKKQVVNQTQKAFEVAKERSVMAAKVVDEVQAGVRRADAYHQFWQGQYDRFAKLSAAVIDQQTKDETWNQLQSAKAGLEEAKAKVDTAKASWEQIKAEQEKVMADISVAEADRDRVAALVDYTKMTSPFNGVVTRRNINTRDFVQPPNAGKAEPLYVVERQDVVRIFVWVPEADAAWVRKGSKARIKVQALQGQEFEGEVARTAHSLDAMNRTLLTEIDLPNKQDQLRPGMYTYATITAQNDGWTLPTSAVITQGDMTQGYQSFCFIEREGKVYRQVIELGVRQGPRVQVLRKLARAATASEPAVWEEFSGSESIVQDGVGSLQDGQFVTTQSK